MKKIIREKISDFFNELANISLVGWMSWLGCLIGFSLVGVIFTSLWRVPNKLNLFAKIILTLFIIIIGVLYTAGTVALSRKEKEEEKRYLSIEDYHTYKKFSWGAGSYAEFIVKASNKYVGSIYEKNMNDGIACAIMDFMDDNDNINSLYSIKLFDHYIRQHRRKYENSEVTVYCFLLPYNGLSMTPFAKDHKFQCNYDKEFLEYLKRSKTVHSDMNKEIFESISYTFKFPYRNDEFNIGFRCPEGFDYWKYANEKDLPIFVKVRGNLTLDQYSNSFVIGNCRFEEAYYEKYISTLRERKQEWKQ